MKNHRQAPTPVPGLTTHGYNRGFGGPSVASSAHCPQETLPFLDPGGARIESGAKAVPYGHIGNPEDGRVAHGLRCTYTDCEYEASDSEDLSSHGLSHGLSHGASSMPFLKHGMAGGTVPHGVSAKWIKARMESGAENLSGGKVVRIGTMAAESRAHENRARQLREEAEADGKNTASGFWKDTAAMKRMIASRAASDAGRKIDTPPSRSPVSTPEGMDGKRLKKGTKSR